MFFNSTSPQQRWTWGKASLAKNLTLGRIFSLNQLRKPLGQMFLNSFLSLYPASPYRYGQAMDLFRVESHLRQDLLLKGLRKPPANMFLNSFLNLQSCISLSGMDMRWTFLWYRIPPWIGSSSEGVEKASCTDVVKFLPEPTILRLRIRYGHAMDFSRVESHLVQDLLLMGLRKPLAQMSLNSFLNQQSCVSVSDMDMRWTFLEQNRTLYRIFS